jgi:hypothetical protein
MRNLLALAAFVVLVVAGLGWYLGWYQVQRTAANDGHQSFNVDLNTKKIKEDVRTGEDKIHKAIDGISTDAPKKTDAPASNSEKPNPGL